MGCHGSIWDLYRTNDKTAFERRGDRLCNISTETTGENTLCHMEEAHEGEIGKTERGQKAQAKSN